MYKRFFASKYRLGLLSAGVLLTAAFGVALGSTDMDLPTRRNTFLRREGYDMQFAVLYSLRLPRVLGGILAGIGLSVSGAVLQTVTATPLG